MFPMTRVLWSRELRNPTQGGGSLVDPGIPPGTGARPQFRAWGKLLMKALHIHGVSTRLAVLGVVLLAGAVGAAAPYFGARLDAGTIRTPGVTSSAAAPSITSPDAIGGGGSLTNGAKSTTSTIGITVSTTNASAPWLLRFSPLYMGGGRFTLAQAQAIARNYDVIAEHTGVLTPYIAAMKAINPSLKIVAYINGAFDQSSAGNKYPASWYAHDAHGSRVKSVSFGNWLMLPTSQWASNVSNICKQQIAQSHYDGCFLDTLGIGPLLPGYVTGVPVSPSTHKVFTSSTWIADQANTINAVRSGNPSKLVLANGLADGQKFSQTSPLLAAAHMAMSEIWLRVSKNPEGSFPSTADWLLDVNMLVNAASHGYGVMTVTKLWVKATPAQIEQWHRFTLTTFLMGDGGQSGYCFTDAKTAVGLSIDTADDNVAIGTPTGAYSQVGGAYKRSFTNGIVAVNPGSSPVTIQLGSSLINLSGAHVTSETLAPHTGDVFHR
jgi:Hypothetical glycosyl hydrolase family 15